MLEDSYRHRGLRKKLVRIVEGKGITDKNVLDALAKVPRHYFFDKAFLEHAYQDKAFPIGEGQTISQPFTVAFQTQLLEIRKGDKVLTTGGIYGKVTDVKEKTVTVEIADNIMQNQEEVKRIYDQLLDTRMRDLLKSTVKLRNKEISYDDFIKLATETK